MSQRSSADKTIPTREMSPGVLRRDVVEVYRNRQGGVTTAQNDDARIVRRHGRRGAQHIIAVLDAARRAEPHFVTVLKSYYVRP